MPIDRMPPDWREHLKAQLESWSEDFPDCHCYALIDGAQYPALLAMIRRWRLDHAAVFAHDGITDRETLTLSPLLAPYPATSTAGEKAHWFTIIASLDGLPASSLIITPEALDKLAARWSPWCRIDAAGQSLLLRFSDARILPELLARLSPEQRASFLGPARALLTIDRCGQWRPLPTAPADAPVAPRVALDETQCAGLVSAAEPDETLAMLAVSAPQVIARHLPSIAYKAVQKALLAADRDGVTAAGERSARCLAALDS